MKKNIDKLEIAFVGDHDWKKLRNILILKMSECQTKEEFSKVIQILLASMFKNVKEIDKARKEQRLKLLSEIEKKEIDKIFKSAKPRQ